jgi:aminoglycoside 3-N-acetyltransferase
MNPRLSVTQSDIQNGIRQLDLSGRAVCVHSSLRSFGYVVGGAQAVVRAFVEEGCTLMVPSFSDGFRVAPPKDQQVPRNGTTYEPYLGGTGGADKIYTPSTTEIDRDMGAIAAAVIAFSGSVRGNHPICSFCAVGPLAHELIETQVPLDIFAPLAALAEREGCILLMGVGLQSMTLLHLAEKEAGRTLFRRWANDSEGRPQMLESGGCSDGFEHLAPVLQPWLKQMVVGESVWQMFPARQSLYAAAGAIRANPLLTHCGNPECDRCNDAVAGGPIL